MQGTVDLWSVLPGRLAHRLALIRSVLTDEELVAVERMHAEGDRRERATARGALRMLLGAYLGLPPAELVLTTACKRCGARHGKPELVTANHSATLHFSVAHSGGAIAIAVSGDGPVGVDVEPVATTVDPRLLHRHVLHPTEQVAFDSLPSRQQQVHLLRTWVRKEAYLKGIGIGLGRSMTAIRFTEGPGGLCVIDEEEVAERCWTVTDVATHPGYLAAVATSVGISTRLRLCALVDVVLGAADVRSATGQQGAGAMGPADRDGVSSDVYASSRQALEAIEPLPPFLGESVVLFPYPAGGTDATAPTEEADRSRAASAGGDEEASCECSG